ncbi:MAG: shikimate dehydrogenase [Methanomicrobiales archaeon]|nr:shikimate dehydrogenase [Methanomicrobiales archaeon]
MRIVLCGFRGTGKTECGILLSRLISLPFFDTDALIEEQAGKTIHEIFSGEGEEIFRDYERQVIATLPGTGCIIGTGGGAVIDPRNVEALRRGSTMILLEAEPAAIEQRIRDTTRPPLTTLPLRDEIRLLLKERKPFYTRAADFCIDTTTRSPNEVCLAILRILAEGTASPGAGARAVRFLEASGIPENEIRAFEQAAVGGDPKTRLFAIAGNPSVHSRSPALFSRLFAHYGLNCHYTRLQAPDIVPILRLCHDLDFRALSVTIPFKSSIMEHLSGIEPDAGEIGAVNTVVWCGGRSYGSNTDWIGIRDALTDARGSKAVVLGAGGAAAAAVYALKALSMEITVLNRTVSTAEDLAGRFGCESGPPEAFDRADPDIVINATPVGMEPDTHSPLKKSQLKPSMTVFDLVYTPAETPLLRLARAAGCRVIPGTEMFVRQAAAQFRHFTGISAPLDLVRSMML